jgi:hypothetical protein
VAIFARWDLHHQPPQSGSIIRSPPISFSALFAQPYDKAAWLLSFAWCITPTDAGARVQACGLARTTVAGLITTLRISLVEKGNVERAAGVEPTTSSLESWHSTAELRPQEHNSALATCKQAARPCNCREITTVPHNCHSLSISFLWGLWLQTGKGQDAQPRTTFRPRVRTTC